MPPPLQRKRAAAALSQAGRAGPDEPIRAIQLAGRPHVRDRRQTSSNVKRQTDVRRASSLNAPAPWEHKNYISIKICIC